MRVVRKELIEHCLPSAPEYRYEFAKPWSRDTIRRLGELGQLEYFGHFPRPFFRVRLPDGSQIRGVEGDACCRVIFAGDEAARREEFDGRLAQCLSRLPISSRRS